MPDFTATLLAVAISFLFLVGLLLLLRQREQLIIATATLQEQNNAGEEKLKLMVEAKSQMSLEFKNLANQILQEKSQVLNQAHETQLNHLLNPFKSQLKDFEKKIETVYSDEAKQRFSLTQEIKNLQQLNQQISRETINLTNVLQGQIKTQGCWGEVILERVLELSGLEKGREYATQVNLPAAPGKMLQPDAIIYLPDERQVVVDAKVTLTAYSRYQEALQQQDEAASAKYLQQHLQALQTHIKTLSSKAYHDLCPEPALDFVLLFMPIEGAFSLAMQADPALYHLALSKNIHLVTPTTLLATLRTIENIWRFDKQNKNAMLIASKGAALYDKFAGLCHDMSDMGKKLDSTQKSYDLAMNKLSQGRGNLMSRVEALKQIGVKASKKLPEALKAAADERVDE